MHRDSIINSTRYILQTNSTFLKTIPEAENFSSNTTNNANLNPIDEQTCFVFYLLIGIKLCCTLSVGGLTLSALSFSLFSQLYNVRNTIHRNLCLSLLAVEFVFYAGIFGLQKHPMACRIGAIFLHYFLLSAFLWMLLEGYLLYKMIIKVFDSGNDHLLLLYFIGYGTPIPIVLLTVLFSLEDYGTETYCWINVHSYAFAALMGPVFAIIFINGVVLILALKVLTGARTIATNIVEKQSKRARFFGWLKGSASLLCLLGITWILGFLTAVGTGGAVLAFMFTLFNCIQGMFIYILHVLLNDNVRRTILGVLKQRYTWFRCLCNWIEEQWTDYVSSSVAIADSQTTSPIHSVVVNLSSSGAQSHSSDSPAAYRQSNKAKLLTRLLFWKRYRSYNVANQNTSHEVIRDKDNGRKRARFEHEVMQDTSKNAPGIMAQLRRSGFEEASQAFTDIINDKIRQVTVSMPEVKYSETYLGSTWEVTVSNIKIDHFDTPDAVSLTPSEPNVVDVYCPNLIIRGSADIFVRQPGFLPDMNGKVLMSTQQASLLMSFVMNNNAYTAQPISSDIMKCDAQLGDWDITFNLSGISGWIVDKMLSAFTYIFYGTIGEYLQPQVCEHASNFVKTYVNDNFERIPPSVSAKDVLESMGITESREPSNTIRSYVRHILQSEKLEELLLFYGVMGSSADGNTFTVELDGSFRQNVYSERPRFNHWKISPSDFDATNEMMLGLFISDYTVNSLFEEMQRISFLDIVLRPDSPTSIGEFLRGNCNQRSCLKDLVPVLQRSDSFQGKDIYLRIKAKRAPSVVFGQDGRVFVDLLATVDFMVGSNNRQDLVDLKLQQMLILMLRSPKVPFDFGNKLTLFANIAKLKLTEIGNGLQFTEADLDIDNEKIRRLEEEINNVLGTLTIPTDIAEDFVTLRKTDVHIVEHALQIDVDFQFKPISTRR
ncbi:7 transmembrane receptor (Secretin family) domain-containing protein [Ditylenchus destructor]|nr:7 transmembrane receptor (Secretin family) domain-containing protein [Ditylenchus destructor]